MRFISAQGAPDIPLEVLNVQENDKLIFFCGAGISYPAGLPGFRELVNETYQRLGGVPNTLEKEAIKRNLYDRALDLLERRYQRPDRADNYLVRKKIIECLQLDYSSNVNTHKAILELAKTKDGGVRLVEPPRICRRLHFLRGWSNEQSQTLSPGDPGTGRAPCP